MMRVLNVGIFGCGTIAQIMHLPYLQELAGFCIYSLCDISKNVVEEVGARYGVPESRRLTEYEQFLSDENLDLVFICTKEHFTPVMAALQQKLHVFVEKPFGVTKRQAVAMSELAQRQGVILSVGYMKRYDSSFRKALELIWSMEDIHYIRVHNFGGSFRQVGTLFELSKPHDIDPRMFKEDRKTMEQEIVRSLGEGHRKDINAYKILLGVFSHDSVLMRHAFGNQPEVEHVSIHNDTGLTGILKYGEIPCCIESDLRMERPIWDEYIEVFSKEMSLRIEFPWPYMRNVPTKLIVSRSDEMGATTITHIISDLSQSYKTQLVELHAAIMSNSATLTSGADAVYDLSLFESLIQNIRM